MKKPPYDQRIARVLVRPLARLGVTANQITAVSLVLALGAGALFALGGTPAIHWAAHWAAGVFVLARFLDHFDGELARLTGETSRFGYYFDYVTGGLSHAALFAGIGWGLAGGPLGGWALAPVTWLGWLEPFLVAAGIGATVYLLWTLGRVLRARTAR